MGEEMLSRLIQQISPTNLNKKLPQNVARAIKEMYIKYHKNTGKGVTYVTERAFLREQNI